MRQLRDLGEFGLIERVAKWARRQSEPQVAVGIGDDAAVLRPRAGEDLVVSSDAAVEGVHFRWDRQSPADIGRRALVANLSDLAAMGARPLGFTLALAAPPTLPLERFDGAMRGVLACAGRYACPLIGGNLTRARQTHFNITVLGAVARGRALLRSALRPGDRLFVTGALGVSALALARSDRAGAPNRRVPVPRLEAARALSRLPGHGACIDLSDGFASDLGHLLDASGLGAEIDVAKLPRPRGMAKHCRDLGLDPETLVVSGGEDYELLFSMRKGADCHDLARRLGVRTTEVGSVTRLPGVSGLEGARGWRHF